MMFLISTIKTSLLHSLHIRKCKVIDVYTVSSYNKIIIYDLVTVVTFHITLY